MRGMLSVSYLNHFTLLAYNVQAAPGRIGTDGMEYGIPSIKILIVLKYGLLPFYVMAYKAYGFGAVVLSSLVGGTESPAGLRWMLCPYSSPAQTYGYS